MRLPSQAELWTPEAQFLYHHDLLEWHNPNRLYRPDYLYRLRRVIRLVSSHASGQRCLEVGCAQANATLLLAERGFWAVGLDLRLGFVQYARLKHTHGQANFLVGSGNSLPFKAEAFDVVILTELLEHVAYPEDFLQQAIRVLAPGGILVVSTPNGQHRWSALPTFAQIANDRQNLVAGQFQPDADGHLFLFTMAELCELVEGCGFQVLVSGWYDLDITTRIYWHLGPMKVWQGALAGVTRPASWLLLGVDRLLRASSLIPQERFARGLLLVAAKP